MRTLGIAMIASCATLTACSDDGESDNENEVITTVSLRFAPSGGGAAVTAAFDDPDGDGGAAPTIDPVRLAPGDYTLTVRFENRLASPAEDITEEVRDEQDFHLLLFTGSAVVGPATGNATGPLTQSYADTDGHGLPIGLTDAIVASPGTGQLTVTLRHMPPEEPPVKAADTVMIARTGGIDAIGGSTDAQVSFEVTVQ
jgi:hypothetical protein